MSGTDHNPPAFPVAPEPGVCSGTNGMTLRDYFAAQALVGLMQGRANFPPGINPIELGAKTAYAFADAMLEARK